jgi:phage terminase large subunit-like protein
MLKPLSEDAEKFNDAWLRTYDDSILPPAMFRIAISVDPASTLKKKADYTSMIVHGWDTKQNWFLLDVFRDRLPGMSRVNKLIEFHKKWAPFAQSSPKVLYETVGFQTEDKANLERVQHETGYYFPIIGMKGGEMHKTKKKNRILGLQKFFERNIADASMGFSKILIPKSRLHFSRDLNRTVDMMTFFLAEYRTSPDSEHDDMLDALSFPLFWDEFKGVRANQKKEQHSIHPDSMNSMLKQMGIAMDMRKNPGNAHFTDQQLADFALPESNAFTF